MQHAQKDMLQDWLEILSDGFPGYGSDRHYQGDGKAPKQNAVGGAYGGVPYHAVPKGGGVYPPVPWSCVAPGLFTPLRRRRFFAGKSRGAAVLVKKIHTTNRPSQS